MTSEELQRIISEKFPGFQIEPLAYDLTFIVPARQYISFCVFLKQDPGLLFDNLMCLTGLDNVENLQLVLHLSSYVKRHRIGMKVTLDQEAPKIESVMKLWPGANWHEREAYDLYGIVFEGHPDLRRILLSDDWDGYPMRKGYTHWNLTPLPDDVTEVMKDYPTVPNPL